MGLALMIVADKFIKLIFLTLSFETFQKRKEPIG